MSRHQRPTVGRGEVSRASLGQNLSRVERPSEASDNLPTISEFIDARHCLRTIAVSDGANLARDAFSENLAPVAQFESQWLGSGLLNHGKRGLRQSPA